MCMWLYSLWLYPLLLHIHYGCPYYGYTLLWLCLLYHRCLPRITFPKLDIGNHSQPGNVAVVAGWGHLADAEGDDALAGFLPDELHSSMVKPDQLPATYNVQPRAEAPSHGRTAALVEQSQVTLPKY